MPLPVDGSLIFHCELFGAPPPNHGGYAGVSVPTDSWPDLTSVRLALSHAAAAVAAAASGNNATTTEVDAVRIRESLLGERCTYSLNSPRATPPAEPPTSIRSSPA